MKPINRKLTVSGASWELRVKLSDDTRNIYSQLKQHYELKAGRSLSESAFLSQLLPNHLNSMLAIPKDAQH